MFSYLVHRLVHLGFILLGVTVMVFLMLRFLPGDPALILAGEETAAEQVEQVHYQMGGALRGKLCRLPAPGKRNILKSDLKYLDLNII